MEVMITQHDNGASHIAVDGDNITITNVAGLSLMIGGVQVDVTDHVKKLEEHKRYLEDHKRKFDRTLVLIRDGNLDEYMWENFIINTDSNFYDLCGYLEELLDYVILDKVTLQRCDMYFFSHYTSWAFPELNVLDRNENDGKIGKIYNNHISPSIKYREKEWNIEYLENKRRECLRQVYIERYGEGMVD
jgi:hypothetical protein